METKNVPISEIEALSADLDFIERNNIDAKTTIEDFRSAINFATSFPNRPTTKRVIKHIQDRLNRLKPVELEIIPIAA